MDRFRGKKGIYSQVFNPNFGLPQKIQDYSIYVILALAVEYGQNQRE
ncbi:MAG: hypothetical protein KDA77_07785 [Planctomycetaceae bacterium]|nr:hypothetical protein [Planctomycetaceae bacterium]